MPAHSAFMPYATLYDTIAGLSMNDFILRKLELSTYSTHVFHGNIPAAREVSNGDSLKTYQFFFSPRLSFSAEMHNFTAQFSARIKTQRKRHGSDARLCSISRNKGKAQKSLSAQPHMLTLRFNEFSSLVSTALRKSSISFSSASQSACVVVSLCIASILPSKVTPSLMTLACA